MVREISQPIGLIAVFQKGKMVPLNFSWNGRAIKIDRITGRWNRKERRFHIELFAPAVVSKDSPSG